MKNQFQTFLTAISASFATLCFVLVTNPDASFVKVAEVENLPKEVSALTENANTACANEPFIGQLMLVGFNFAPRNWALCNGQLLQISDHTALFSLLGTTYGGDGRRTFALPDLRGRAPVHVGTGPGLSTIRQGQKFGSESVGAGTGTSGAVAGAGRTGNVNVQVNSSSGGGTNAQPSLGVNYVISLYGVFPSRN